MKKKSICFFTSYPPPYHGANYAVNLLLNSDLKNEFDVTHINTSYVDSLDNIGKPELYKITLFFKYILKLFILNKKKHFDYVILIPSFSFWVFIKDSLTIHFISYFTNIKIILWVHTNDFLICHNKRNYLFRKFMLFSINKSYRIVTVGENIKYNFDTFVKAEKLVTIYNGLKLTPRITKQIKKKIEIIFLSNMMLEKGWMHLLKSAEIICSNYNMISFKFYGSPSRDCPIEFIKGEFEKIRFREQILYLGKVEGQKKIEAFTNADIFCLPSYSEALPFSILEAMQYSVAVVATRIGSIPEAIIEGKGGLFVEWGNINELVRSFTLLIENPRRRIEMGEYNRNRFEEIFCINSFVGKWGEFFNSLI